MAKSDILETESVVPGRRGAEHAGPGVQHSAGDHCLASQELEERVKGLVGVWL